MCCLLSKHIKVKIYRTIILPFVLYGCETWSPTVSEDHRLRMFGNVVLRKIFGPMRHKVTGGVRKMTRMRWAGHVAHMGEEERCVQDLGEET